MNVTQLFSLEGDRKEYLERIFYLLWDSLFNLIVPSNYHERVRNVYLSSDSDEILALADDYPWLLSKASDQYATDTAKSEEAILHWLSLWKSKINLILCSCLSQQHPYVKWGQDTAIDS